MNLTEQEKKDLIVNIASQIAVHLYNKVQEKHDVTNSKVDSDKLESIGVSAAHCAQYIAAGIEDAIENFR